MVATFIPSQAAQPRRKIFTNQLDNAIRRGKYMEVWEPQSKPLITSYTATVPILPTAVQGQLDTIVVPGAFGNNYIEMFQTTAQTLFPTPVASSGWDFALDRVDNESVEYVPGGNLAGNPLGMLVGTDPGVFIKATFTVTDRSGTDQFLVGFRKQEAFAVPVSLLTTGDGIYVDFAGIGFSGTTSDLVKTMTDVGNAGSTTVTDTTFAWADTKTHTLEVRVTKGGVVTYFINGVLLGGSVTLDGLGAALTLQTTVAGAAYTFTNALQIIPWIFHRHDTTTPGAVTLRRLQVGQLASIGAGAGANAARGGQY